MLKKLFKLKKEEENEENIEEIEEEVVVEEETVIIEEEAIIEEDVKEETKGFFGKLIKGLNKTRQGITDKIDDLFTNYGEIDEELFEELEEILIMADVGMNTTMKIIDELREKLKENKIKESSRIKEVLRGVLLEFLQEENDLEPVGNKTPSIVFVIGVNGAGKTTSIGKLANALKNQGKSVLLAAGDTFRAAAIDQLKIWGERVNVPVISQQEGSDPASVVFDSIQAAKSRNIDVLIIDTAGRLHNKVNLMNELAKIFKIVEREYKEAEKEVLLVLDATTGQNAIQQAKLFKEAANITGLILTKLDGTAKGGAILAVKDEVGVPVKLIGVGEGIDDLQEFNSEEFVDALLNTK